MKLRVVPVLALTFSLCTSCSNVNKTTEKIVPVMTGQGVYSVNFTSYNELTENLLNSIDAIKKDMDHNKFDNINIKEFEDRIFVDITDLVDENDVVECDDCNYHEYIIRDGNGIGVGYIITHEFV